MRERRARRQKKNDVVRGEADATREKQEKANDAQKSRQRMEAIEAAVTGLPDNEALRTVKELLADKHDREVLELNEKHQKDFNAIQEDSVQDLIASKSAAIKALPDHLPPGTNIEGILLNLE